MIKPPAFGVSKDQIQKHVKRKADVLEEYSGDTPSHSRCIRRKTDNDEINELIWRCAWSSTCLEAPPVSKRHFSKIPMQIPFKLTCLEAPPTRRRQPPVFRGPSLPYYLSNNRQL